MPPPECVNQSRCREVTISTSVPIDWALPLYGYAMPIIVAITIATNSFIVLVLSHRYLRTPTNYVLLAMAVTELLTGLSCVPWLLYYYTFNGYQTEEVYGLPGFWCTMFPYMATIFPSIFHTAAIWLTVYLAAQRYIYICLPKLVREHCTLRRSKHAIITICIASIWIYSPEFFAAYNQSFEMENFRTNVTKRGCFRFKAAFLQIVGHDVYYFIIYGLHTLIAHTLPCILLVGFTWQLIAAIRLADKRHAILIARSATMRKYTLESNEPLDAATAVRRDPRATTRQRSSFSESKRIQGLKQNTRMLIAVIILFLVTEIPAALIFSVHVSAVALRNSFIQQHYALLNKLLIVRNILIVMSYPFRFAIYCGMSQQFRLVVREMVTQRVFFPCGKRAQNLMRNIHHSGIPLNDSTNPVVGVQFSDERKSYALEEWPPAAANRTSIPRASFLNAEYPRNETLIQVLRSTTPRFFFKS